MADDSERVGGISVDISISDAEARQGLERFDAVFNEFVSRWEKRGQITLGVAQGSAPAAGQAPAAVQAGEGRPASAPIQYVVPQQERRVEEISLANVRFGAGRVAGHEYQALLSKIADAANAMERERSRPAARQPVEQARHEEQARTTEQVQRGEMPDPTQAITALVEKVGNLTSVIEDLARSVVTQTTVTKEAASTSARAVRAPLAPLAEEPIEYPELGGAGGPRRRLRRKNLRDRAIGTEVDASKIYTFDAAQYAEEERLAEARAARERELDFSRRQARMPKPLSYRTMLAREIPAARQARRLQTQARAEAYRARLAASEPATEPTASAFDTGILITGRTLSDDERTAIRARDEEYARAVGGGGGGGRRPPPPAIEPEGEGPRPDDARIDRYVGTRSRSFEVRVRSSEFRRAQQQAEIERRAEQAIAQQQAQITASGRTSRTLASTLGSFFFGPRQEQIEAQARLQAARSETASATRYRNVFEREMIGNEVAAAHAEREGTRASLDRANALRKVNEEIKASPDYKKAVKEQTAAIEAEGKATERLAKLSSGFGTAARSLIAVTAGGAAFGAGLKAIDVALSAVVPALGDLVERQAGFAATSNRVTQALAAQTAAQNGNVQAVLANAEATAGLSSRASDFLNTQLKMTTEVKAGALAQQQASDLFRAAVGANAAAPQGLYGGFGGLFNTPLLAQQLGGGKGFAETIAGDITAFQQSISRAATEAPGAGLYRGRSAQFGPRNTQQAEAFREQLAQGAQQAQSALPEYIANLNDEAKRGATALGLGADGAYRFAKITVQQAEQIKASNLDQNLKDIASVEAAQRGNAYALVDSFGQLVTASGKASEALEQMAVGANVRPAETQVQAFQREMLAQFLQEQRQLQLQVGGLPASFGLPRQGTIEQQFGISATTNPALVGNQTRPLAALGVSGSQLSQVAQGYTEIRQEALAAADAAKQFVSTELGASVGQDFANALGQAQQYASQIARVQLGVETEQAQLAAAQYAYNIYIAKRNLQDALGLTGKITDTTRNLGAIERQQFELGRESQALSLGLAQKQINFQRAIAGFSAPGQTPAEREANVKQAKIEADYAQKQLDIQKQLFGLQGRQFSITASRSVTDLVRQLDLLQQGRRVSLDTAAAQKQLTVLQVRYEKARAVVNAYYNAAVQRVNDLFGLSAKLVGTTVDALGRVENAAIHAFASWYSDYIKAVNATTQALSGSYGSGYPGAGANPNETLGGTSSGQHAMGGMFQMHAGGGIYQTQGLARLGPNDIAGEAGTETVAILRNPRALTQGSGAAPIININHPVVRDEVDITRIAREVARAMGTQATLRGLRPIGG